MKRVSVPYSRAIDAYRVWNRLTGKYMDLAPFLKFLKTDSLMRYKLDPGPAGLCMLSLETAQRIEMLLGPNAPTIVKVYLIRQR